jgi:hypothetical protein
MANRQYWTALICHFGFLESQIELILQVFNVDPLIGSEDDTGMAIIATLVS